MCNGRLGLLLLTIAIASMPRTAEAQRVRELTRRLDVAVAARTKASSDLANYRKSQVKVRVYRDSLSLLGGAVAVVSVHEIMPTLRAAVSGADAVLTHQLGPAASRLRGTVLAAGFDTTAGRFLNVSVAQRTALGEVLNTWVHDDSASIAAVVMSTAHFLVLANASPVVARYVGALPVDTVTDDQWATVRVQLVTSPSKVAAACYAGEIVACKAALGLTSEAEPLTRWYDATGRRALVPQLADRHVVDLAAKDRCLAGSDADCLLLLRADGVLGFEPPTTGLARMTFVSKTIDVGGPGAVGRLVTHPGPISDALSAAAGVPVDSVVHLWQQRIQNRYRRSDNMSLTMGIVAIGWVLLLYGFALRSTRWR